MAIRVGCGSWADAEYMGLLYPKAFPPDLRLCAYAMWFDYVEVNASYYAIPKREAVEKWVEQTPASFLFDIRLPRAISQSPEKAGNDGRLLNILLKSLEPLLEARKLGVFLLVLSPFFKPGKHRLEELGPLIETNSSTFPGGRVPPRRLGGGRTTGRDAPLLSGAKADLGVSRHAVDQRLRSAAVCG